MAETKKEKIKKKILVVEDDEDIRNLVLFNLEMTGEYELLSSDNGEDALVLAQKHIPALVILDVMLPGIDGFEVCRQLKSNSTTRKIPIVILTARSDDNDVVKGFELGVEDYLRKPFSSMKILLARVSNILQRHDIEAPKITLGELELNPLNYSVIASGEAVDLSYSEFKILQLLMENPGVAYTREAIMTVIKAGKNSPEYEDAAKKKAAADDFFRIVGTHVITKCLLGCELNYRMTVDSKKVYKSTDVDAALDFKWQQQIKDTTGVDSAAKAKMVELMKDSTKLKNFFFSGGVQVTDAQFDAASSTKAKVKARGNDVQLVNILATGGSLNCTDLAQWMLGAEPEKATMVGRIVHPIYDIFDGSVATSDEAKAREYLKGYIDKHFSLDSKVYGNKLDVDLSDLK